MFSFVWKKASSKNAVFAALVLVLLAGCSNGTTDIPVAAGAPEIKAQPSGGVWADGTLDLTVTAVSPDGGILGYQWYGNTSSANTGGTLLDGKTSSTLTLNRADYFSNGNQYFYVEITNVIADNGDGGAKTKTITSDTATVTVSGVDYTAITIPENLKGHWTSEWDEEFTITTTTFESAFGGEVTYAGDIVNVRGRNGDNDSGYVTIKYTTIGEYSTGIVDNYYVIHWRNLIDNTVDIFGAADGEGKPTQTEAEAAHTVENGQFEFFSSCTK